MFLSQHANGRVRKLGFPDRASFTVDKPFDGYSPEAKKIKMAGITSLTLSAEVEEKLAVLGLVADPLGLDDTTPSRCVSAVSRLLTEAPLPRVCTLTTDCAIQLYDRIGGAL